LCDSIDFLKRYTQHAISADITLGQEVHNNHNTISKMRFKIRKNPVYKIAEKALCRSAFLTTWHCILSAQLTKRHSFRLFFGDFCPLGNKHIVSIIMIMGINLSILKYKNSFHI